VVLHYREADIRVPYFGAPLAAITLGQRAVVKSVRFNRYLLLLLAAPLFWSCASARIGFQSDGSYVLERGEQSADCQALHKNIMARIQVVKGMPARAMAEQASAPPTASSFFGRWFGGPNKGLDAVQEYNRERAHVYALQRTMVEKKCLAVDVDGELAQTSSEMARFRAN
jgi:hypothetical protein